MACKCLEGFFPGNEYNLYGPMVCHEDPFWGEIIDVELECTENPCPENAVCALLEVPGATGESIECKCRDTFFPGDVYNMYGPAKCYDSPMFQLAPSQHVVGVHFINEDSDTVVTVSLKDDVGSLLTSRRCDTKKCGLSFEYQGMIACEQLRVSLEHHTGGTAFRAPSELTVAFNGEQVLHMLSETGNLLKATTYSPKYCPTF